MDSYSRNKQLFKSLNLDLYSVEKIKNELLLLKVNIEHITFEEIDLFITTISLLINEVNNNLIIDLSETQSLDEYSCKILKSLFTTSS